jgi:hypothetical protein
MSIVTLYARRPLRDTTSVEKADLVRVLVRYCFPRLRLGLLAVWKKYRYRSKPFGRPREYSQSR